jgi:hypothetical protein
VVVSALFQECTGCFACQYSQAKAHCQALADTETSLTDLQWRFLRGATQLMSVQRPWSKDRLQCSFFVSRKDDIHNADVVSLIRVLMMAGQTCAQRNSRGTPEVRSALANTRQAPWRGYGKKAEQNIHESEETQCAAPQMTTSVCVHRGAVAGATSMFEIEITVSGLAMCANIPQFSGLAAITSTSFIS